MPLSRFAFLLLLLLVIAQGGLTLWRNAPIPNSTALVFSFPPAVARFDNPGTFAEIIERYHADRGAECKLTAADDSPLTLFYFEWDRFEDALLADVTGHAPEVCNVAAGFELVKIAPMRSFDVPGQLPLKFDCTHFKDPAGRDVFMFKMAWLQGLGAQTYRIATPRMERLNKAIHREIRVARVLQAVVYNNRDADHAWQTFQSEVLEKLTWQQPHSTKA